MKAVYEKQDDLLYLSYGVRAKDGASLEDDPGVMLDMGTDGGCDIVAVTIMGAASWFNKGFDEASDKWLIGDTTDDLEMVTINGDFVGYCSRTGTILMKSPTLSALKLNMWQSMCLSVSARRCGTLTKVL